MSSTASRTRSGRPTAGPGAARPRRPAALVYGVAVPVLLVAVLAGIWVGAVPLAPGGVVVTLLDRALGPLGVDLPGGLEGTQAAVLLQLRLPRVVLAVLVGAALAIAGAGYQGVFRNPLADPYLLGAAAGAGLGATLTIAYAPVQSLGPVGLVPLAAFAGALLGVGCALALGTVAGGSHSPTLLLAGIAVAAFLSAAQTLVQQQNTDDLREIYGWMIGQLGSSRWSDIALVLPTSASPARSCSSAAGPSTCWPSATTRPPRWACTRAGCGCWSSSPRRWPPPRPWRSAA